MVESKAQTILLIEDSPEDCTATIRAFQRCGFKNSIVNCADGDDALDYLYRRGSYAGPNQASRPALILLDLNLPGTDGREVLERVKSDESLCHIPIVILTTSVDDRDIHSCYKAGANSYIQKPVDVDGLFRAVQSLKDYWFEVAVLPTEQ
jgi:CheY-like chemotaxis protein